MGPQCSAEEAVGALVETIELCLDAAGLPRGLSSLGVGEATLDTLAEEAAGQWTAQFNPRAVDRAALRELYERALG